MTVFSNWRVDGCRQQMRSGELSARDLVSECLRRVHAEDDRIGAFLHIDEEVALAEAKEVDEKRQRGEPLGPLAGIPVALKDVMCVAGDPTTAGSRMLGHFEPPYDAHVVERLRAADAILFGKTNLDEFAMGSSTENSAFQITRNPQDPSRSPGGSSGGSASAVAAGFVPLALGTDTGGSIRQPAAFCGVVGMKPTYGRVSRYGLIAFASSLDQIGPFAADVSGAAALFSAVAGKDHRDSTSLAAPTPDFLDRLTDPLTNLRVGLLEELLTDEIDSAIVQAVQTTADRFRDAGAQVETISLPRHHHSVATYYLIASSEASSNLARYDGIHYGRRAETVDGLEDLYSRSRGEAFGSEVKRRIMLGTFALSHGYYDEYYLKAQKVRRLIKQDYDAAFSQCDVLLGPVTPSPAFRLGEHTQDPLAMYLSDVFTIGANLAGLPAISLPAGTNETGLPVAVQLTAAALAEETLFRAAKIIEA